MHPHAGDGLTFLLACRLMRTMRAVLGVTLLVVLLFPSLGVAVETAQPLSDREIIERLTRLEEGLDALRASHEALRASHEALRAEMQQLRVDMAEQNRQLREDMNTQFDRIDAQFDRLVNIMVAIVLAFAGIVAATITFAIWDRRTMIRPFESQIRQVEAEMAGNRQRLHALLEALRAVSQQDPQVAEVLKRFNLL